jgi:NTP pyrophosphatase (non-canonical NTP hydrolase)
METGNTVLTLARLQQEHFEWTQRNFPGQSHWECFLGLVEELGELTEAHIKGDADGLKDAAGDIIVYLAGYCTANNYNLQPCVDDYTKAEEYRAFGIKNVGVHVGRLAHAHLKMAQGIRGDKKKHIAEATDAIAGIYFSLRDVCTFNKLDLHECIESAWAQVKQRDWKKDPVNAGGVAVQERKKCAWCGGSNASVCQGDDGRVLCANCRRNCSKLSEDKRQQRDQANGRPIELAHNCSTCGFGGGKFGDGSCEIFADGRECTDGFCGDWKDGMVQR